MTEKTLGIIGGSGLYDLPGLEDRETVELETPFGKPSDALVTGTLHGVRMAFLPRHGRGHRLAPNELPFRANIHAMKQLGMSAVGGAKITEPKNTAENDVQSFPQHPGEDALAHQSQIYWEQVEARLATLGLTNVAQTRACST